MQSTGSPAPSAPPAGWYPDPWQLAPTRWWDGIAWTGFTTPPPAAPSPPRAVTTILPTNRPDGFVGTGRPGAASGPFGVAAAPTATLPAVLPAVLPAARDDVRGGGIAILGFFGAIALALLFARVASAGGARPFTVPTLVFGQLGLWTGLCLAACVATRRRTGGTLADLGFRTPTGVEVAIGIGAGIASLYAATRFELVLRSLFPDNGSSHLFTSSAPSLAVVLVVGLLACIGAPIVEELFFRGLVQSVLTRHLGTTPAIVVQAVLFGLAHFQLGMTFNQAAVRCGTVMVLGLVNGCLRVNTGRLGTGIVAHATYNAIVTVITLVLFAAR